MPKTKIHKLGNEILKPLTSVVNSKPEDVIIAVSNTASNILKETDYYYLLVKSIEIFSFEELKFTEKLLTKHDFVLNDKKKELVKNIKSKFGDNFISDVYNRLIKIRLSDINSNNKIRTVLTDEDNTILCGKFKTCNGFWIPFWLDGNNYKTLSKISNDEIHMLHQLDCDNDDDGVYLFGQYFNQELEQGDRYHFWYDKNKKKYVALKKIEGESFKMILYPVKNKRGKILYGKYKNSLDHIIPFWYSSKQEKYVSLKIEGEIICDTSNRKRKKGKLISGTFLNDKGYHLPFWREGDTYVTLKIEGEEIHNTKNRKRDEKGKLLSGEFLNKKGIWQKFKLEGGVYIIKQGLIKRFTSIFT